MEQALRRLSACTDQAALVTELVEEAVRLTGSTLGYFATADEDRNELVMLGWSKSAMAVCAMSDKPILYPIEATGLWGDCIRERRPVITNDYPGCRRVTKKGYPDGHVPVERHLNVPVMWGQRIVGVLGVGNRAEPYSDDDAALLQAFANAAWPLFAKTAKEPRP
jgi:GAF domain-containing protein